MLVQPTQCACTDGHTFLLRYDGTGFIVNDVQVQGAVFCLADLFMMWNLKSWQELTPDALSMLHLFKPAPGNAIVCASYLGFVMPTHSQCDLVLCKQIWSS